MWKPIMKVVIHFATVGNICHVASLNTHEPQSFVESHNRLKKPDEPEAVLKQQEVVIK